MGSAALELVRARIGEKGQVFLGFGWSALVTTMELTAGGAPAIFLGQGVVRWTQRRRGYVLA